MGIVSAGDNTFGSLKVQRLFSIAGALNVISLKCVVF